MFAPAFRKFMEPHFHVFDHLFNIVFMMLVLSAFISIAAYAGTSILFGAFLAGSFLTYLPSRHPDGPFVVLSREQGEKERHKSPTFIHTFEYYCLDFQVYILEPLFFASIGFAIPFLDLWTGEAIWHGVVYTLLMMLGKFLVGIWLPVWASCSTSKDSTGQSELPSVEEGTDTGRAARVKPSIYPGLLLGMAMVARGEIGLLIVEIGYHNTPYVTQAGFLTAIWAILLNTILGPIAVGLLVKYKADQIANGDWGLVEAPNNNSQAGKQEEANKGCKRDHERIELESRIMRTY